jgi:hypothetical protein
MKWEDYVKGVSYVKLFVKARPRAGKTYLAASASRLGKTLFIDAEGGLITAKDVINAENLDIEILPTTDPKAFSERLNAVINRILTEEFDWVVLDSFTEITGQLEDQYSKGEGQIKDWMTIIEKVKKLGRFLRDGDFHCIMTCLMKPDTDPILPGQTSTVVPSFYNTLGMIETRKVGTKEVRALVTQGFSSQSIGDRLGILDSVEVIDAKHPETVLQKLVSGVAHVADTETKVEEEVKETVKGGA